MLAVSDGVDDSRAYGVLEGQHGGSEDEEKFLAALVASGSAAPVVVAGDCSPRVAEIGETRPQRAATLAFEEFDARPVIG